MMYYMTLCLIIKICLREDWALLDKPVTPRTLDNTDLCWSSSFKYLGINFLSGLSFKVDISCIKRSFYKSCNGILRYSKTNDEFVRLSLKSHCLPLLTYCIGAIDLSDATC